MSKITKKQLHNGWHYHDTEIIKMKKELRELKQSVLRLEKLTDEKLLDEPQLKQLDQDDDIAKELLEIDLSIELTGSDLARAMLARGDKFILCGVSDSDDSDAANHEDDDFLAEAVTDFDDTDGLFGTTSMQWIYAVPINNQGEPLTASEVGL